MAPVRGKRHNERSHPVPTTDNYLAQMLSYTKYNSVKVNTAAAAKRILQSPKSTHAWSLMTFTRPFPPLRWSMNTPASSFLPTTPGTIEKRTLYERVSPGPSVEVNHRNLTRVQPKQRPWRHYMAALSPDLNLLGEQRHDRVELNLARATLGWL